MNGPPLRAASANTPRACGDTQIVGIAGVDAAEQRVHESFKHLVTGTGADHLAHRGVADQSGVISQAACLQLSDTFSRNNPAGAEFIWFQRHAQDALGDRPKCPVNPG